MRRHACVLAIIAAVVAAGGGCGRQKSEVVARVNQQPITQRQLWEALEQGENGEAGRRTLDSLIVRQLIRQEAKKRGIEVSQEELQTRLEGLKDYVLAGAGKDFEAWMAETGETEEDVKSRISLQMLTAKLVIPDRDREQYFEENKERLAELPHNNEAMIYRQIVVASKEEAQAAHRELTEAKEGEKLADFAEVAEARSLDPMTRLRGGMVGWMVKGKSQDPKLEEVLFSLKPGEISQPLPLTPPPAGSGEEQEEGEAPELWRIVKVEKYNPAHEVTFEGNADVIEEWMLKDPQFQMQLQEFFEGLRAQADVEVLSPRYRAVREAYARRRDARQQRLTGAGTTGAAPQAVGEPGRRGQGATPAMPAGE